MAFDPIALAHDVDDAFTFEHAVLQELARSIGFDAAFFAAKGDPPTTVNVDASRLDSAIARVDYEAEIAPTRAAALARRGVAVDTSVMGEAAVRRTAYFRDFAAPIGGKHSLLAYLSVRGRPTGGLMLGRTGRTFSDSDIAIVEDLLPRLSLARASFHLPWGGAPLASERANDDGGDLVVRDRDGWREMVARGPSTSIAWTRAHLRDAARSGWFYVDLLHLAATRARHRGRVLFIGCGGGVALHQFARTYPGMRIDVAEPDARVIVLARRWFSLDAVPNVSIVAGDGAALVRGARPCVWDAIVVDAFENDRVAPPFLGRAFFAAVARALRPGGGMAFNAIGTLGGASDVQVVERRARQELDDVRLVPVLDPGETFSARAVRNVVVLGRARP
jgi:hypothetical protein